VIDVKHFDILIIFDRTTGEELAGNHGNASRCVVVFEAW
jgi:hypothetical protein